MSYNVVVVGAGFGGLAAAAELARLGLSVTVLEAHIYPGGCAGTFYHQKYRFDAGATLAGTFAKNAPMAWLGKHLGIDWEARFAEKAMQIHLPGQFTVTRWADPQRWKIERTGAFGSTADSFWTWQENTADALWDFAMRFPAWPPQNVHEVYDLARKMPAWATKQLFQRKLPEMLKMPLNAFQPVLSQVKSSSERFRLFLDAQLLISAQTTSRLANALYGAVALDLPRQGVAHVPGGMGGMAQKLVGAVRNLGGEVHFRQEVTKIRMNNDQPSGVETRRGDYFPADFLIFNLPPWNISQLMGETAPKIIRQLPERPQDGWGAFTLYLGVDSAIISDDQALHHQVVAQEPLGETNSIFMSFSPSWDVDRAPKGKRALTISTHTALEPWWRLYRQDTSAYEARKTEYMDRIIRTAEVVFPDIRSAIDLALPGTPITFSRFTHRAWGWVGGFPQTSLFRAWAPRIAPKIWIVGDTIFPGQSVPAVTLGGIRIAHTLAKEIERKSFIIVENLKRSTERIKNSI
jgi:C-3',4' desaturase CrtD